VQQGPLIIASAIIDFQDLEQDKFCSLTLQPNPLSMYNVYPLHVFEHEPDDFFQKCGYGRLSLYFLLLYTVTTGMGMAILCDNPITAYNFKKMRPVELQKKALSKSENILLCTLNGLEKKGYIQNINNIIQYTVKQHKMVQEEGLIDDGQHESLVDAFDHISNNVAKGQDILETLDAQSWHVENEQETEEGSAEIDTAFSKWRHKMATVVKQQHRPAPLHRQPSAGSRCRCRHHRVATHSTATATTIRYAAQQHCSAFPGVPGPAVAEKNSTADVAWYRVRNMMSRSLLLNIPVLKVPVLYKCEMLHSL